MLIARILSPVHSLGPGERVCIWTQGCHKACQGCVSPELQPFSGNEISESKLAKIISQVAEKNSCTGITISGGDPFEQPEALRRLLEPLSEGFRDILVYTGYTLEEIKSGSLGESARECLEYIGVLIDGRYVDELNSPDCVLRGSENQKIYFLNKSLEPVCREYMKQGRILESFSHGDTTIITGIFNKEV
ncbi:MAG: radical SAM protein [Oscillospiraceae bacterium]|nr:radical SAM protein [Oscillospiraceae bacterium]